MRMDEAAKYFASVSKRQYAEVLHNYGTNLALSFSSDSLAQLNLSERLLQTICDKEIYYPQNSKALYYAIHLEYEKAISIWEKIDCGAIQVDFCRLAIQNNLLCAYIKAGFLCEAESLCEELGHQIAHLLSSDQRPDVQHPIRQYYLNCGLLSMARNQNSEALKYFERAHSCSKYPSTMLYLIEREIKQLQTSIGSPLLKQLRNRIGRAKPDNPNAIEKYYADHRMYFCIIMFWGDS